jgi:hypothetical protein
MDKIEEVIVFVNATSGRLMSMVFSYYHLRQARSFDYGARDALESRFLDREWLELFTGSSGNPRPQRDSAS